MKPISHHQPKAIVPARCGNSGDSSALTRPAALLLALATLGTLPITPARADVVTDWNSIMQDTVAAANANFQARAGAITQLSVFEAVNAITGDCQPYLGTIVALPGASPDAAAVAAAHRALVALFPASTAALNTAKTTSLAAIPNGPAEDDGVAVGVAAANAMLLLRSNDGAAQAQGVPYTPGADPGDWQPAPPTFTVASQPGWGLVTPFGLESGAQFRLPPPPRLNSGRYAKDHEEVRIVGDINAGSDLRPQDRTDVANFFSVSSPVQVWNLASRQASAAQGATLSENARIFAVLAMAMADASIATYETKYYYNFWRPQMAIRGADSDDNHHTTQDPNWRPLLPTPAFPSYPSAHATLSNAARSVLERFFGIHGHAITLTSPRLAGVVLNYTDFRGICDDIDDARVYGGIHFQFEQDAGARQGKDVGTFIHDNYLLPLEE